MKEGEEGLCGWRRGREEGLWMEEEGRLEEGGAGGRGCLGVLVRVLLPPPHGGDERRTRVRCV